MWAAALSLIGATSSGGCILLDIITSGNYQEVEGYSNFKDDVLEKGKSNIYNDFWELENYSKSYIERLGS